MRFVVSTTPRATFLVGKIPHEIFAPQYKRYHGFAEIPPYHCRTLTLFLVPRFAQRLAGCPDPSFVGDGECDIREWWISGFVVSVVIYAVTLHGTSDFSRVLGQL